MSDQVWGEMPLHLAMEANYARYAQEVVLNRALPDARDGLKPVHRRILYACYDMRILSSGPHKKSARIVGEVLGKYHPHGDKSVYDAMVGLAQDFSMRLPLIDGQGNFGSADGDGPAAMRYTEARLSPAGEMMLRDIKSDTVDWQENFDQSLQEPKVLPTPVPSLLVNGSQGIAVGMAAFLPPHNLGEVCDAIVHVASQWKKRDKITVDELMKIIPGPDYPTGGVVYRYRQNGDEPTDMIRDGYETGRSVLVVGSEVFIQDIGGGKSEIVVTAIPYGTSRSTIKDRVADKKDDFRQAGVSAVTDLSDRNGMKLVFETVRGVNPEKVLQYLLSNTKMQDSQSYSAVALVSDGAGGRMPQECGLLTLISEFIEFRLEVIIRRTRNRLEAAQARLHIVEGLLKAIDVIDEVIDIVRRSRSTDTARRNLMKKLGVDEIQANAILDMRIRQLARLEKKRLLDEEKALRAEVKTLQALLRSEKKRLDKVIEETADVKKQFATPRLTKIIEREEGHESPVVGPVSAEGPQMVVLEDGGIKLTAAGDYRDRTSAGSPTSRRVTATLMRFKAQPADPIVIASDRGRLWKGAAAHAEEAVPDRNENIIYAGLGKDVDDKLLVLLTSHGKVKRTTMSDILSRPDNSWAMGIGGLDNVDRVVAAAIASDGAQVVACSFDGKKAYALRFNAKDANPQASPSARGVAAIKLEKGAAVVGGAIFEPGDTDSILILSEGGYLKRVALKDFPVQGRAGRGVTIRVTKATGPIVACASQHNDDSAFDIYSVGGKRLRLEPGEVRRCGRTKNGLDLSRYGEDGDLFGEPVAYVVSL